MLRETPECQLERCTYRLKLVLHETSERKFERRAYRLKRAFVLVGLLFR